MSLPPEGRDFVLLVVSSVPWTVPDTEVEAQKLFVGKNACSDADIASAQETPKKVQSRDVLMYSLSVGSVRKWDKLSYIGWGASKDKAEGVAKSPMILTGTCGALAKAL